MISFLRDPFVLIVVLAVAVLGGEIVIVRWL
jgi:hypothetical protein